jgi:hypothetical protein
MKTRSASPSGSGPEPAENPPSSEEDGRPDPPPGRPGGTGTKIKTKNYPEIQMRNMLGLPRPLQHTPSLGESFAQFPEQFWAMLHASEQFWAPKAVPKHRFSFIGCCTGRGRPKKYSMLHNIASGPEIGLPGRILSGMLPGMHRHRSSDRPSACRRADFGAFPVAVRPKSGPEGRFPARKHYCVT